MNFLTNHHTITYKLQKIAPKWGLEATFLETFVKTPFLVDVSLILGILLGIIWRPFWSLFGYHFLAYF
jgi:hypothetical protein